MDFEKHLSFNTDNTFLSTNKQNLTLKNTLTKKYCVEINRQKKLLGSSKADKFAVKEKQKNKLSKNEF